MRHYAKRLIAEELRRTRGAGATARAAFRVCERLRRPLTTYAGAAGCRSLLRRALHLARVEAPWLDGIQVAADGSIECSPGPEEQMSGSEAAEGGIALVTHLLTLLVTFVGEALTFRLVQEVWPKAAIKESKPKENQP